MSGWRKLIIWRDLVRRMTEQIKVSFFSTYKLDRINCLAEAIKNYSISLKIINLSSRNPINLLNNISKQPRSNILLTHDWMMIPVLMSLSNLIYGYRYVLISNSLVLQARKIKNEAYPELVRDLMPEYKKTADILNNRKLRQAIEKMEASMDSLTGLQKAHRKFLLILETYR